MVTGALSARTHALVGLRLHATTTECVTESQASAIVMLIIMGHWIVVDAHWDGLESTAPLLLCHLGS